MKEVDLFVAIRRKKENRDLKERTIRHIIRDYNKDINIIKSIIRQQKDEAIWRIYKTVNKRDVNKAMKELQHKIIENPEQIAERMESSWKTALLQPKCKAENNLLIDIDNRSNEKFDEVLNLLNLDDIVDIKDTLNGFHIIIKRVDVREIEKIEDVEVKRDALVFLEVYQNGL